MFGNSELLRIRIIRDDESVVLIDIRVFILDRWTSPKADGHHIITDIFIQCFSQINLFRVVVVCPQPSAWTQIKKETRIARTLHGLVFHGSFFDIIELMILGFDLFGFASAGALPFLAVSLFLLSISTTAPT